MPESKIRIKEGHSLKYSEIRFMKVHHSSLTGTLIYNNKILLTIRNLDSPIAISIENDDVAQSYKDNFEILRKASREFIN